MESEVRKANMDDKISCHGFSCVLLVGIKVNDKVVEIRPGKHAGSEILRLSEFPATHELGEIRDGKIQPILADQSVDIRGCEQFIAHPCEGSAS